MDMSRLAQKIHRVFNNCDIKEIQNLLQQFIFHDNRTNLVINQLIEEKEIIDAENLQQSANSIQEILPEFNYQHIYEILKILGDRSDAARQTVKLLILLKKLKLEETKPNLLPPPNMNNLLPIDHNHNSNIQHTTVAVQDIMWNNKPSTSKANSIDVGSTRPQANLIDAGSTTSEANLIDISSTTSNVDNDWIVHKLPDTSTGAIPKRTVPKATASFGETMVKRRKEEVIVISDAIDLKDRNDSETSKLAVHIMEMFPNADGKYIRQLCRKSKSVDEITSLLLDSDYPKRCPEPEINIDIEEQLEIMKAVLPDADPTYLSMHCERLINKPDELKVFVAEALENKTYPTKEAFLRNQQISAQAKQYTTEFDIPKFLDVMPNPRAYFNDPTRRTPIVDDFCRHYIVCFLKNCFRDISLQTIRHEVELMNIEGSNLSTIYTTLSGMKKQLKSGRKGSPMPSPGQNIPLLQEIAYLYHKQEILQFIDDQKELEKQNKVKAKENGLLQTCNCCYDDEVMPKDVVFCGAGCMFCRGCVEKGFEVLFAEGKVDVPCLSDCSASFNLHTLQQVLKPKLFSKLAHKKQLEEVKAAGIEDLEMCPFCDFATIPAKGDKLFRCLNTECMKESCRLCHEPSHIPLKCEEVEKDVDVQRRTYIENKMTEALIRKCYKCGLKFIKADGCNKMTCSCGGMMCYVCGAAVKDYSHFNGQGGDKIHLCPLFSDTIKLHKEDVLKGAAAAKEEIGAKDDPTKLKSDPTVGIEAHFKPSKNIPPHLIEDLSDGCTRRNANKRTHEDRKNTKRRPGKRIILDLAVTIEDTDEKIAKDIANKLCEEREDLILTLIAIIGKTEAINFFKETKRIEESGGMLIMVICHNQHHRRQN